MSDSRLHFIAFADGSRDTKDSGARIIQQALKTNLFQSAICYNSASLKASTFWNTGLIDENSRGYGFWIWKPLLIQYVLRNVIMEKEILVYCDAGSEIVNNFLSRHTFLQLLSHLEEQDVLAFDTSVPEYQYTKRMCLDLLSMKSKEHTSQVAATTILFHNTAASRTFTNNWVDIATQRNGIYIDDSLGLEHQEFREHRHDQSIFSVLYKNANMKSLMLTSPRYSLSEPRVRFYEKVLHNNLFFWQIRNRTGKSSISSWQSSTVITSLLLPITLCRPFLRGVENIAKKGFSLFLHLCKHNRSKAH